MPETDNDGFYWEPETDFPLRQGDLLYNVATGLMPDRPRFVMGEGEELEAVDYDEFPDLAPSDDIVVEARFGALAMVVTPTCHVSEGEKDEDILAVVPVDPLGALVPDRERARTSRAGGTFRCISFRSPRLRLARASCRSTPSRCSTVQHRCSSTISSSTGGSPSTSKHGSSFAHSSRTSGRVPTLSPGSASPSRLNRGAGESSRTWNESRRSRNDLSRCA
ncbi:MAG: hypothetical protein ACRDM7_18385 [Thermoleophilaceae bacterium]